MKKLYLATKTILPAVKEVMFLYDDEDGFEYLSLREAAKRYFEEEDRNHAPYNKETVSLKEITLVEDIPKEWRECALLWGTNDEITATGFLTQQNSDPEYQEYLRLKEKFEK